VLGAESASLSANSGSLRAAFGSARWGPLGANAGDSVVDQHLQLIRIHPPEAFARSGRGPVEHPPADRLLDELRKVALAQTVLREIGPQGDVGLPRYDDRPYPIRVERGIGLARADRFLRSTTPEDSVGPVGTTGLTCGGPPRHPQRWLHQFRQKHGCR